MAKVTLHDTRTPNMVQGQVRARRRMPEELQVWLLVRLEDGTLGWWMVQDVKPIDPDRMRADWYVAPGGNVLVDHSLRGTPPWGEGEAA